MASNPNSPANYGAAMKSAYKATKTFGNTGPAPKMAAPKMMKKTKMTVQYAKPTFKPSTQMGTMSATTPMTRTKTRSAAFRTFGGKY